MVSLVRLTLVVSLRCVAAVLHLGNIQFEVVKKALEEDSSAIANLDVLQVRLSLSS